MIYTPDYFQFQVLQKLIELRPSEADAANVVAKAVGLPVSTVTAILDFFRISGWLSVELRPTVRTIEEMRIMQPPARPAPKRDPAAYIAIYTQEGNPLLRAFVALGDRAEYDGTTFVLDGSAVKPATAIAEANRVLIHLRKKKLIAYPGIAEPHDTIAIPAING